MTKTLRDVLIPVEAVCASIGKSKPWLYQAIARGEFPAGTRLGSRVFWRARDIEAYLDAEEAAGGRQRRDGSVM